MDTLLYGAPHGLQLAGVTNWESALTAEERDWLPASGYPPGY
jgi:hypothetical protein